jgi:DNA methyltransferase 1-associated protein 1
MKMSRFHLGGDLTCLERELTRKKYLLSLENRTSEQIAEEEALFVEVKRLEQNERKFKKEREELLRTLAGIESGLPDIVEDDMPAALAMDTRRKKKGGMMEIDSPLTPSSISLGPPIVKRPQTAKSAAYGTKFSPPYIQLALMTQ